jgi:hypothetical protein
MFRFLLILSIIGYLIYKIGGFFFKAGAASQQIRQQPPSRKNSADINAEKDKRNGNIKGGEYVDYEEVK